MSIEAPMHRSDRTEIDRVLEPDPLDARAGARDAPGIRSFGKVLLRTGRVERVEGHRTTLPGGSGDVDRRPGRASAMTRRQVGGGLLAVGAALVLLGVHDLAEELWPDGRGPTGQVLLDLLVLVLPGLVAMAAGTSINRRP
jgi:hypothetical protein